MPRYFFNVYDGIDNIDHRGIVLDSVYEARLEAVRFAGRFIDIHAATVQFSEEWRLEAVDDRGLLLFRIEFVMSQSPASGCLCSKEQAVRDDRIVGLFQISPSSLCAESADGTRDLSPPSTSDGRRAATTPAVYPSFFDRAAVLPTGDEAARTGSPVHASPQP